MYLLFLIFILWTKILCIISATDEDMKRLNNKILSSYNKHVLPVEDPLKPVELLLGLKLDQIVDIDERNQVMTTNVWLVHEWTDSKLKWNPAEFGGVQKIQLPSTLIWLPDVVLYNNADGTFVVNTFTWAHIFFNGTVKWTTPVTYKSQCVINIQYYPFDIQNCSLKFGVWSHGKKQIILRHLSLQVETNPGVDLSEYEQSVEWDLLAAPAIRHETLYDCCPDDSFFDVTFCFEIRRKSLFYTVNLVVPCICIAFLAVMVFHLPSACGEKMTLSISILVALQVFYLLMIEILPSTSVHVPLLGKYLLFTFIFVSISIILALIIANIHFRDPKMHRMPMWARELFFHRLPPILFMDKPTIPLDALDETSSDDESVDESDEKYFEISFIKQNFRLIQNQKKSDMKDKIIAEGWAYVALVLDRIFLIVYSLTFVIGTCVCLFRAPALYDARVPLLKSDFNLKQR